MDLNGSLQYGHVKYRIRKWIKKIQEISFNFKNCKYKTIVYPKPCDRLAKPVRSLIKEI